MLVPFEGPASFDPGDDHGFIRFSPGGGRVVVGAADGDWAVMIDVQSAKQLRRFTGLNRLESAFFLAKNRLLLSDDDGLTIHDLASGKALSWSGKEDIGRMAWPGAAPGRIIVYKGGLYLYDLKKRRFGRGFAPLLPGALTCLVFSPDGRFLAADAYIRGDFRDQRFIQVWDARSKPLFRLFEVRKGQNDLGGMAFSPDNRILAVSVEKGATILDLESGEPIGDFDPGPSITNSVRFSPTGRSLELVSFKGEMARINPKTGRVRQRRAPPKGYPIGACAVSDQGLAAGVVGTSVLFWQFPEWKES